MSETRFPTFRGAVPEVITPFHPDGSIAYELLQGEMEHCLRGGVGAIFTNGLRASALPPPPRNRSDVDRPPWSNMWEAGTRYGKRGLQHPGGRPVRRQGL